MKKMFFLLIAAHGALSAFAQTTNTNNPPMQNANMSMHAAGYGADSLLSKWAIDVNLLGGTFMQDFTTVNPANNYPNALTANTGKLSFNNGYTLGISAQLGYFFDRKGHFGVGTGIMHLQQYGFATLDAYKVDYKSYDANGDVYRQIVTANHAVSENLEITNINIPLLLKFKTRFSRTVGFTMDAGVLFNVYMRNYYKTNASFDYEAIYKHVTRSDGSVYTVYDNSTTPSTADLVITQAQYNKTHPDAPAGSLMNFFTMERGLGYNVGLGMTPNSNTGNVSYNAGSVGIFLNPGFNIFFNDKVALNLSLYYLYQSFTHDAGGGTKLTDRVGDYNSVLTNVSNSANQSFGGSVGIRILFGHKYVPLAMTVKPIAPSYCGMCDGALELNGFTPNRPVMIMYGVDGTPKMYANTAGPDGSVRIPNQCAGNYSGITAFSGKKKATSPPVTIAPTPLKISSQATINPSAAKVCDGSVTFSGLKAGQEVTITYFLNDQEQTYTGKVRSNGTVVLGNLCAGKYADFIISNNDCKVNGTDVTLAPPVPTPKYDKPEHDMTEPVLFDLGQIKIKEESLPILTEAAIELNNSDNAFIIVDGHTDNTGSAARNDELSFARANEVKKYITKMGGDPKRMIAVGHGSKQPIAPNTTKEGRKANRRVIMSLKHRQKDENK